ncbi:RNA deprotection pyrophosphohydrolase [Oceanobacillus sp. FSL H7-0719]
MMIFKDFYKNEVQLSFENHPFSKNPKHVWVICRYKGQWLLTKHKERGLEFPGGKVELGETAEEAAIREVHEETGGIVEQIHYIGQYYVNGRKDYVIKNVYFAIINRLIEEESYYETDGPVLLSEIPGNVNYNQAYSFIMKDQVLDYSMEYIEKNSF